MSDHFTNELLKAPEPVGSALHCYSAPIRRIHPEGHGLIELAWIQVGIRTQNLLVAPAHLHELLEVAHQDPVAGQAGLPAADAKGL